jgi:hypothetical protein
MWMTNIMCRKTAVLLFFQYRNPAASSLPDTAGGVGRTDVIIGRWLARNGSSGEAALSRLHELWRKNPKSRFRRSPETPNQERYIMEWREPA